MPTALVFRRVVAYALLLSAVDAVSGRMLQASPDPSIVLSLGATAWVSYRLAEGRQGRLAVPAGITLWLIYFAAFVLWARLLVGWNGSVPWAPRSTTWMMGFALSVPVVAIVAQRAGAKAATRAKTRATMGTLRL